MNLIEVFSVAIVARECLLCFLCLLPPSFRLSNGDISVFQCIMCKLWPLGDLKTCDYML